MRIGRGAGECVYNVYIDVKTPLNAVSLSRSCDFTLYNLAILLPTVENSLYGEFGVNLLGGLVGDTSRTKII